MVLHILNLTLLLLVQSYLWNCAASHRARELGLDSAVAGDLVLEEGAAADSVGGNDAADDAALCDDDAGNSGGVGSIGVQECEY